MSQTRFPHRDASAWFFHNLTSSHQGKTEHDLTSRLEASAEVCTTPMTGEKCQSSVAEVEVTTLEVRIIVVIGVTSCRFLSILALIGFSGYSDDLNRDELTK